MYLGRGLRTAIFGGRGTAVFPSHPSTLPPAPSRASDGRDRLRQAWGLPSARPPKLGGAPRTHKPAHIFALTLLTPGRVRSRSFFGGRGPTPTPPRVAPIKSPARFQTSPPPTSGLRRTAPHRTEIASRTGGGRGKGDRWVWGRERERGRDSYREIHLLSSLPVTLVCRRRRRPLPRARVGRGVVRGVAPPSPLKP